MDHPVAGYAHCHRLFHFDRGGRYVFGTLVCDSNILLCQLADYLCRLFHSLLCDQELHLRHPFIGYRGSVPYLHGGGAFHHHTCLL